MTDTGIHPITTGSVTSADGTTIGYRSVGSGPGLLILHGAMEHSGSHLDLARALADVATVHLPDRRGRGLSGPYRADDGLAQEVQDVQAVLAATGTRRLFGISSGGVICLQVALGGSGLDRIAVFDPVLGVDGSMNTRLFERYDREIDAGDLPAALVTGMSAAQLGPPIFRFLPRPVLERLTRWAMVADEKKAAPGEPTMATLAPNLRYDFRVVAAADGRAAEFAAITVPVLLLGGGRSPAYLHTALDALQRVLPDAQRTEFAGLDHNATGNTDRRGTPVEVANRLRAFLAL
jgi:pimeloyl-ACP methyl ester carboxylesterase